MDEKERMQPLFFDQGCASARTVRLLDEVARKNIVYHDVQADNRCSSRRKWRRECWRTSALFGVPTVLLVIISVGPSKRAPTPRCFDNQGTHSGGATLTPSPTIRLHEHRSLVAAARARRGILIYIKTTDVSLLRIASWRLPPDEPQRSRGAYADTATQCRLGRKAGDLGGQRR